MERTANDLHSLVVEQLGVNTRPKISTDSVGTAATRILSNEPNRVALTIINLSTNGIHIMIDNLVSATRGILIGANGGSVSFNWQYDMDIIGWEWWAVATGADSDLLIIEEVTI